MPTNQPTVYSQKERPFTTSAIALQAIIINKQEQILLLNSPTRNQGWQVISGALDAGETILDGVCREVAEEAGAASEPGGGARSRCKEKEQGELSYFLDALE